MFKFHSGAKGLTLIELMITMAIAGILVAGATPSLTEFVQNNRAVTQINDLQGALGLARSEAIKRNNNVTLCASDDAVGCHDHMERYHHGWIVFVDSDFDGNVDAGEEILRVHGEITGDNKFEYSDSRVITYASNGLERAGASGTFTLCDNRGTQSARGIILGVSGRARLATDSDSNDIPNDDDGKDLQCS